MKKYFILAFLMLPLFTHTEVSEYVTPITHQPVFFSIVREDADQDLEIIKRYFPEKKPTMIMIASGGCTVAHLLAQSAIKELTVVDPNQAQLALTQIKILLLGLPQQMRLKLLGYMPMESETRKSILEEYFTTLNLNKNILGNLDEMFTHGIDFTGRYENVFAELRRKLTPYQDTITTLFECENIEQQKQIMAPESEFGKALDSAFDAVMSQENLVAIFGEKATANRVQEFSRHFAHQTRNYLAHHRASDSPWLARMLTGNFYGNVLFPWLTAPICGTPCPVTYNNNFMNDALKESATEQYDVVHLSNIIDWLTPQEATKTLELAYNALKPGGVVVIRQLNSNVDVPSLGKRFAWDTKASREFTHNDRSFFYRNFFIGYKEKPSVAPQVQSLADTVLEETPIMQGSFFKALTTMDKEQFQKTQEQFFFAVDYFSRPMAALVARLPLHQDRIDIIHNIVEEHGDFNSEAYHSTTFKQFLATIGVSQERLKRVNPLPVVDMFNTTLMGLCANEDPIVAIACNGIIEYAFADISAHIGHAVVEREWVTPENLIHYNLHAEIDKEHAAEFFKIIEPYMHDAEQQAKIESGLRLGAYIFNRLYEDMYAATLIQ